MSITTIKDTRVRVRPSKALLKLIAEHQEEIVELPENLMKVMKRNGYELSETKVEILSESNVIKPPTIDKQLLQELTKDLKEETPTETESNEENDEATLAEVHESYLYLNDLRWLNQFLTKLRKAKSLDIYLHSLLDKCALELPENEKIERNPELEARCQKLREQQQNLEYYKMTKNVDAQLKHYPEDTVAYQMKAINGQVIAVFQFVVSVMAGFAFGFLGVGWIIGDLDFGFRLLLGVMCALVIALAEIYFLAKKLVEYDTAVDAPRQTGSPMKHPKMHKD